MVIVTLIFTLTLLINSASATPSNAIFKNPGTFVEIKPYISEVREVHFESGDYAHVPANVDNIELRIVLIPTDFFVEWVETSIAIERWSGEDYTVWKNQSWYDHDNYVSLPRVHFDEGEMYTVAVVCSVYDSDSTEYWYQTHYFTLQWEIGADLFAAIAPVLLVGSVAVIVVVVVHRRRTRYPQVEGLDVPLETVE